MLLHMSFGPFLCLSTYTDFVQSSDQVSVTAQDYSNICIVFLQLLDVTVSLLSPNFHNLLKNLSSKLV